MVLKTGEVKVFLGEREIGKKKREGKGIQKAKKPERERGVRPTHIKKEGGGKKKKRRRRKGRRSREGRKRWGRKKQSAEVGGAKTWKGRVEEE